MRTTPLSLMDQGPRQENPYLRSCGCCMSTWPKPPMTTAQASVWGTLNPKSQATPAPMMMIVLSSEVASAGARKCPKELSTPMHRATAEISMT